MRTGKLARVERADPVDAALARRPRRARSSGASFPSGVTAPSPVTATRFSSRQLRQRVSRRQEVLRRNSSGQSADVPSTGPSPRPSEGVEVRHGSAAERRVSEHASRGSSSSTRHCPALPARRGVPRAGAPAPPQPRHVQASPRRARRSVPICSSASRSRRSRRSSSSRASPSGAARAAARLPRDRGLPRALAELKAATRRGLRSAHAVRRTSRIRSLRELARCPGSRRGIVLRQPSPIVRAVRAVAALDRLLVAGVLTRSGSRSWYAAMLRRLRRVRLGRALLADRSPVVIRGSRRRLLAGDRRVLRQRRKRAPARASSVLASSRRRSRSVEARVVARDRLRVDVDEAA